ncbi:MAG: hypothetical protein QXL15_05245 [Candidatus Korarchaeota archaeon]
MIYIDIIFMLLSASILLIPIMLILATFYYLLLRLVGSSKYFDILMNIGIIGLFLTAPIRSTISSFVGGKASRRKRTSLFWYPNTFSGIVVFLSSITTIAVTISFITLFFDYIPFPFNILLFMSILLSAWICIEDIIIAFRSTNSNKDVVLGVFISVFYVVIGALSFPTAILFLISVILSVKINLEKQINLKTNNIL